MKLTELFAALTPPIAKPSTFKSEVDDAFAMLDGTNPTKPYTQSEIMKAMKELHARIERQAANYGGTVDTKTGKIDKSKHKFFPAQIAPDE